MSEVRELIKSAVKEPWFYSVLLLIATPLFPDFFCFVLIAASLALAAWDMAKRKARPFLGKTGYLLLLFLGIAAVSAFGAAIPENSIATLCMWGGTFCGYLVLVNLLCDRDRFRGTLIGMTAVGGLVGILAVLQYILNTLLGISFPTKLWEPLEVIVYRFLNIPRDMQDFGERVSGTFDNPNLLAIYLAVAIPFFIVIALTGRRSKPKTVARVALIFAVYALCFSFCRGAYLAMICAGIFLAVLFARKRFVITVLAVIYISLLIPPSVSNRLMSVVPVSPSQSAESVEEVLPPASIGEQLSDKYAHDDSVSMRFKIWGTVAKKGVERPILGHGFGIANTQVLLKDAKLNFPHSHNLFLELFAEGGILLLGTFGALVILSAVRGFKLLLRQQDREMWLIGFAVLSSLAALCIMGVFDLPVSTPRTILSFMVLMGLTETATRIYLPINHSGENVHERQE